MICINCFHAKTTVTNSRPHKSQSGTWRRRKCVQCQQAFTTHERPASELLVLSGAGNSDSEPFMLAKLCLSIAEALRHDKHYQAAYSLDLAQTVEQQLLVQIKNPSRDDIAAITHQTLKRFDELAALQYGAKHQLLTSIRRRGRPSIDQA